MMVRYDVSKDVDTIHGMFYKADTDGSGDIDWKEWPALDEYLQDFDSGFYSQQEAHKAVEKARREERLSRRAAKAKLAQTDVQPADDVAQPKVSKPDEADEDLAAAIKAQSETTALTM